MDVASIVRGGTGEVRSSRSAWMGTEVSRNWDMKVRLKCSTFLSCLSPNEDAWLHRHTHAPHRHSVSTRVITGKLEPPPPPTPFFFLPSSLRLSPVWLGELVFCFSCFPEVCLLSPSLPCFLCNTSVNICGGDRSGGGWKRDGKAVYSCQTALVLQLLSGPCDAGDAAEGLWYPAKSAIFRPYLARSVRQWWSASVCQRRGWVRGKNETGGGASAETLYDALVSRGRLFLLAFPWSAIRAATSTSAPSWLKHASGKQVLTQRPSPAAFSVVGSTIRWWHL